MRIVNAPSTPVIACVAAFVMGCVLASLTPADSAERPRAERHLTEARRERKEGSARPGKRAERVQARKDKKAQGNK